MLENYLVMVRTAKTVKELAAAIAPFVSKQTDKPDNRPDKSVSSDDNFVIPQEGYEELLNLRRSVYLTANKIYFELCRQNPSLDLPKLPPVIRRYDEIANWCAAVEKVISKAGAK